MRSGGLTGSGAMRLAVCGVAALCVLGASSPARVLAFLSEQLGGSGVHPRLLLDAQRVASLREALPTTHRFLWERYLQDLPRMVAVARREAPVGDVRYEGDLVPELAFAWLMTGREDLLDVAKAQLLRLTRDEAWNSNESLIYLSNAAALAFATAALRGEDERAPAWLATAGAFFDKTFSVLPADGSSLEGYAYAGYGGEHLLLYALLGRELLGRDDTNNPWVRHFAEYLLHGLLPRRTAEEWAMTFGDAPRRGWTSTAQHLFTLARLNRDGAPQWMAREVLSLRAAGLGSWGWLILLAYDPTLPPAQPSTFPTFKRFPEIDQVMMRSSWTDGDATLVGFITPA